MMLGEGGPGQDAGVSHLRGPESGSLPVGLDWRLLLPLQERSRILVGGVQAEEVAASLARIGHVAVFRDEGTVDTRGSPWSRDVFDVVTMPLGIPRAGARGGRSVRNVLASAHTRLASGGHILLGFQGPLGLRGHAPRGTGIFLGPGRARRALESAGYASVRLYAAFRRLDMPRYIVPLRRGTLEFALRRHLSGRVPRLLLALLPAALVLPILARAAPAYFATAVRSEPGGRPPGVVAT